MGVSTTGQPGRLRSGDLAPVRVDVSGKCARGVGWVDFGGPAAEMLTVRRPRLSVSPAFYRYLAFKKKRRDVTSAVKRHGRAPTINVTKLLVGPSLPDLLEAHTVQDPDDFARAEDR